MNLGNILILGDSYSTFEGCIPEGYAPYYTYITQRNTDVLAPKDTWWHKLASDNECSIIQNNSWSGSTVCHTGYGGTDTSATSSFNHRLDLLTENGFFRDNRIDTVLVFGGTNDSWAFSPIGEPKYENITGEDEFNVLPAFSSLFQKLRSAAPDAKIICIINSGLNELITSGVTEICRHYGIMSVELYDIDKSENHPTEKGMTAIKEQLEAQMERSAI